MFPAGLVGVALVTLRIGCGVLFLTDVLPIQSLLASGWGALTIGFLAFFILSGALTPYLYSVCCIVEVTKLISLTGIGAFHLIALILMTAALAIIGPGAYSLDAMLFGHRRIILPGDNEEQDLSEP